MGGSPWHQPLSLLPLPALVSFGLAVLLCLGCCGPGPASLSRLLRPQPWLRCWVAGSPNHAAVATVHAAAVLLLPMLMWPGPGFPSWVAGAPAPLLGDRQPSLWSAAAWAAAAQLLSNSLDCAGLPAVDRPAPGLSHPGTFMVMPDHGCC